MACFAQLKFMIYSLLVYCESLLTCSDTCLLGKYDAPETAYIFEAGDRAQLQAL